MHKNLFLFTVFIYSCQVNSKTCKFNNLKLIRCTNTKCTDYYNYRNYLQRINSNIYIEDIFSNSKIIESRGVNQNKKNLLDNLYRQFLKHILVYTERCPDNFLIEKTKDIFFQIYGKKTSKNEIIAIYTFLNLLLKFKFSYLTSKSYKNDFFPKYFNIIKYTTFLCRTYIFTSHVPSRILSYRVHKKIFYSYAKKKSLDICNLHANIELFQVLSENIYRNIFALRYKYKVEFEESFNPKGFKYYLLQNIDFVNSAISYKSFTSKFGKKELNEINEFFQILNYIPILNRHGKEIDYQGRVVSLLLSSGFNFYYSHINIYKYFFCLYEFVQTKKIKIIKKLSLLQNLEDLLNFLDKYRKNEGISKFYNMIICHLFFEYLDLDNETKRNFAKGLRSFCYEDIIVYVNPFEKLLYKRLFNILLNKEVHYSKNNFSIKNLILDNYVRKNSNYLPLCIKTIIKKYYFDMINDLALKLEQKVEDDYLALGID